MRLDFTLPPSSKDIDFLTQKINEETKSAGSAYPFAFFIRDDKEEIIAGCNGSVIFKTIHIDQLWVHPDYRGSGKGRELMEQVHVLGYKKGCKLATVVTMDFQGAREFYEHLGYICDFERGGGDNTKMYFLKKEL